MAAYYKSKMIVLALSLMTITSFLVMRSSVGNAETQKKSSTDLNVRELISFHSGNAIFRAILSLKGDLSGTLTIEKIDDPKGKGDLRLNSSWNVSNLPGGKKIQIKKGWRILDLKVSMNGFAFNYASVSGSTIKSHPCNVDMSGDEPVVTCEKL